MGTSALIDMYAQNPRAIGPRADGIRTYQAKHKCPCYNYYVTLPALLKSAQSLMLIADSIYILKGTHYDCGTIF